MPDAVLVADKNRAQDIKVVANLKKDKINQAEFFSKRAQTLGLV